MNNAKARMMMAIASLLPLQPTEKVDATSPEDELEQLTTEYKLIMLKQSKLSANKRASLVRAYKRLQKTEQ